jgi:flagellum-specific ATP synthase
MHKSTPRSSVSHGSCSMVSSLLDRIASTPRIVVQGRVRRVVGLVIEAGGVEAALGETCRIRNGKGEEVLAEVVGFHERGALLMPLGELQGVHPGSTVESLGRGSTADVGFGLLGRVIDALGRPIDGRGPINCTDRRSLSALPPAPLTREVIHEPIATGVRSIDGLLTLGRGQRVGIFAGSGVGKSTLLGMIARYASADVNVIALLGERGREVRDFIEHSLGPEGLARSVVVVATGDEAALLRARGALLATTIAEFYRDQGKNVMLMLDSVTRVAMAWREIGLAVGEPPTTKGYPPSVFAALPRLLERAGNAERGGITGIYTVLVEGDDFNEPVSDAARSILDGHIILSRKLADGGRLPAVEVLESKSRVRDQVIAPGHRAAAMRIQQLMAAYREKEDLIAVGAYQMGTDKLSDAAIRMRPSIEEFLVQPPHVHSNLLESSGRVIELANTAGELLA